MAYSGRMFALPPDLSAERTRRIYSLERMVARHCNAGGPQSRTKPETAAAVVLIDFTSTAVMLGESHFPTERLPSMIPLSRRTFLRSTLALSAIVCSRSLLPAIDPIQRRGKAHMRLS